MLDRENPNQDSHPTLENNSKQSKSRRKILKGLTWSVPVITSVTLPVHAQMTEMDTTPPPPISLTFLGTSITCINARQQAVFSTVFVDDLGVTPVLVLAAPSMVATSITHGISETPNNGGGTLTEFVATPGLTLIQRAQLNCTTGVVTPTTGPALPVPISTQIIAASGAVWNAVSMGSVTATATSMTVPDIILTPA